MSLQETPLGKSTTYFEEYNPSILFPIARSLSRSALKHTNFEGYDLWRVYELTYLNAQGLPQAAMVTIKVPCTSLYIVESKSLKLYLGSFCQTIFASHDEVMHVITNDLNKLLHTQVEVKVYDANVKSMPLENFKGILLEAEPQVADFKFTNYEVTPELLKHASPDSLDDKSKNKDPKDKDNKDKAKKADDKKVTETLYTNLFRSLCPVTGQPDYASVEITYTGEKIDHTSLLAYLVSFRRHQGYHESCVERIFNDLTNLLKIEKLSVTACFTRRGGIDISPTRSNTGKINDPIRGARQ